MALTVYLAVTGLAVVVGASVSLAPELRGGWRPPVAVAVAGVIVQVGVWAWLRLRVVERPVWVLVLHGGALLAAAADPSGFAMLQPPVGALLVAAALPTRWAAAVVLGGIVALVGVEWLGAPATSAWTLVVMGGLLVALCLLSFTFGRALRAQRRADAELLATHATLERTIAELRSSGEQVRELSLQQERARTAGELHDGLGHQLTALGMHLTVAESLRREDPDRAWTNVAQANAVAADALQDLRRWVRALGSPRPSGAWGPDAVASIVAGFASTTLDVRLEVTGRPVPQPEGVEVAVFRAVQEALANVVKHADARAVRIRMDYAAERFTLAVDDDGAGFDAPVEDSVGRGFGLRSLHGRVADLGGDLTLGASDLGGSRVTLTCPLAR